MGYEVPDRHQPPQPGRTPRFFVARHHIGLAYGWVVVDEYGRRIRTGIGPDGLAAGESFLRREDAERRCAEMRRADDAKHKRGVRACLCCGVAFKSEGVHNRLCKVCCKKGGGDAPSPVSFADIHRARRV